MYKAVIIRDQYSEFQTLGRFFLSNGKKIIFEACSLELPFKDNIPFISSIPPGRYVVAIRKSPKFGLAFHVQNVPDRSHILFHSGNYNSQIHGCILLGTHFSHINSDKIIDVANSKVTISNLHIFTDKFILQIISL